MQRGAFTLLELMIVVIIVGILASLAIPMFQGGIIKAKMAELYATVPTIERAEEIYYAEYGHYASNDDREAGGDLPYSTTQTRINNFRDILGLEIPGMDSVFVYGVYYGPLNSPPTRIFVRVREHYSDWGILCDKTIGGSWNVRSHPWAKYLNLP